MTPKTELQKKVVALSSTLKTVSRDQKAWAYKTCLNRYFVRSRKTLYCLECGHKWSNQSVLETTLLGCTCPRCKKDLKEYKNYKRIARICEYFAILETRDDMQIVRMFFIQKTLKKEQKPKYLCKEVMQHWVCSHTGKVTTMSISVNGMSCYFDQWILNSELEVRLHSYRSNMRYSIKPERIYPKRQILPVLKRNGFNGRFYGYLPQEFFSILLTSRAFETLLKTKQIAMVKAFNYSEKIQENWPSIRIAIRNNYRINNGEIYQDYLQMLRYFGKDLHNPKYVCPADLKKEHDRLVEKRNAMERKKEYEQRKAEMQAQEEAYRQEKSKFLDLQFTDGEIIIKPLESVAEFLAEGQELGHCVFASGYYKKAESLILSAKIGDKRLETIEVSLNDIRVTQARGARNRATKYHRRILNVMDQALPVIAQQI
jgi:hypothetical protein